jgi:hypothetical protein
MTQREKLLQKLRNNPKNVRFEDLDKLLTWYEFERRSPSSGSHYVYRRQGCRPITIPYRKPLKSVYVRKALALIEEYADLAEE